MATVLVAKASDNIDEVDEMLVDAHTAEEVPAEEDLYTQLKNLQRQLEFYEIQVRGSNTSTSHSETHIMYPPISPTPGASFLDGPRSG